MNEELTLEKIAQRLYDLAEAERDIRALEAVEAYKAAAHVLDMAKRPPSFMDRLMRLPIVPEPEEDAEPAKS